MNINLKNIDANIKEIDHDIESFEKEIDNIKTEVSNTKTTLLENRNIFTCVMDKFMKLENEEIKPKLEMLTNNKELRDEIATLKQELDQWREKYLNLHKEYTRLKSAFDKLVKDK
jgi:chromosome segregation ATPase